LFLLLPSVIAYLNAILRAAQDSIFSGFRLLLPVAVLVVGIRFVRYRVTWQFALYVAIAVAYYLIQMLILVLLTAIFVWIVYRFRRELFNVQRVTRRSTR